MAHGEKELIDFITAEIAKVEDTAGIKRLVQAVEDYLNSKGVLNTGEGRFARERSMPVGDHFTVMVGGKKYGFSLSKIQPAEGARYSFSPRGENVVEALQLLKDK